MTSNTNQEYEDGQNEDHFEIPSCIESLVSSACQLQQLALDIERYYIKTLVCYGYTTKEAPTYSDGCPKAEPGQASVKKQHKSADLESLSSDEVTLVSMDSLLRLLPFLNELTSFIEKCFVTIEVTLKRSTYYLNRAADKKVKTDSMNDDNEFILPPEAKLHPIFLAIMDLIYALVSLDETIQTHTNLKDELKLFSTVCKLIIDSKQQTGSDNLPNDLNNLPKDRLRQLQDYILTIQLTLCHETKTIFQQFLEHLQHLNLVLSVDKTNKGYKNLNEHFEEFLAFYGDNLIECNYLHQGIVFAKSGNQIKTNQLLAIYLINCKIIPTTYMTSKVRKLFGLSCMFILHGWLFKRYDKRLIRLMAHLLLKHRTLNMVHLLGLNSCVILNEFISKHVPESIIDGKILKRLASQSELLLKVNVGEELERQTMKVVPWLIKFKDSMLNSDQRQSMGDIGGHLNLTIQGLGLAEDLNHLIKTILTFHCRTKQQLSNSSLISIMRMVSLLKSIEALILDNQESLSTFALRSQQIIRTRWRKVILTARKRLLGMRYSERKLDINSIVTISSLSSEIQYLTTYQGRVILSFCIPMFIPSLTLTEMVETNALLNAVPRYHDPELRLNTNCSYLYMNRSAFDVYYNYGFEQDPSILEEFNYFHMALDDISESFSLPYTTQELDLGWLQSRCNELLDMLESDLVSKFKSEFVNKICQELEMEFRLQAHRNIQIDNPFKRHLYNFKNLLAHPDSCGIFRIMRQQISLKQCIEEHLTRSCYSMTVIEPHDWFTYDRMINLARHRFNLQLINLQLPTKTTDHGIDLLYITRNLSLFVSRYNYDLINQLFIEKCTNRLSTSSANSIISGTSMLSGSTSSNINQSLNVIQIRHISRSIQTHGYGVLNSSVNCTYQVMKKLVNLFSKQLSDDRLRAVLAKEHQQLSLGPSKGSGLTFDKANRMAKKFKFNTIDAKPTNNQHPPMVDLDSLRQSITQLGNLLGFIRMLKSGALNCASRSVDYLPDLDDLSLLRLEKFVKNEFQGYANESLMKAAQNFDQCLVDFDENFSSTTNYFNIIIGLFSKILSEGAQVKRHKQEPPSDEPTPSHLEADSTKLETAHESVIDGQTNVHSDKHNHLRLFYLVVPALTINYIDYLINCKERVTLRSSATRSGGLISDDGFSMGVAFLLTVLGQSGEFANIDWFEQVRSKLSRETDEVSRRIEDPKYEEILRQTSSMTFRRLVRLRSEYDGLYYTLSSALLFFRNSSLAMSDVAKRA